MMNAKNALLVLCWQTACLYHDKENSTLLPGAQSATEEESFILDKIHDTHTPDVSWDEFNDTYASFSKASDRTNACINVMRQESETFKKLVVECMTRIACAAVEDNNNDAISVTERNFIEQVAKAIGVF